MSTICKLIGINRQSYYRAKKKTELWQERVSQVLDLVKEVRIKMPKLGVKKLYHILKVPLQSLRVGRDRLFDILRANRLLIKVKRQYHVTTDSHHRFKKHKNLVEYLRVKRPEQVLVSDITYIGNRDNPIYLALVTDAYSKKIMGYNVSESLGAKGALSALKMAIKNRLYPKKELIHHSDRGIQYCCDIYQKALSRKNIRCSMTEKYDPYQNAVAERINGILKQEFIGDFKSKDITVMESLVKNSIGIYNNYRPHFSNHMHTPQTMHLQSSIEMRTYKTKKTEYLNEEILS